MSNQGPLRAFRDRYVASFDGLSYDLAPGAVGVHPDHLRLVPELAGRRVLVSHAATPSLPLGHRPAFTVVSLTPLMRNACSLAEAGGVVFSTFDLDDPSHGRLLEALGEGETVFLNSALDRLPEVVVRRPLDGSAA